MATRKALEGGLRGKQLNSMIDEAETGKPAGGIRAKPAPAPAKTMSQAEFSGYDKKPAVKAGPPKAMLDRLDRTPYNYDKSVTNKKAGRY
jgi:hypothetical protein